jgi:hypothetical protein
VAAVEAEDGVAAVGRAVRVLVLDGRACSAGVDGERGLRCRVLAGPRGDVEADVKHRLVNVELHFGGRALDADQLFRSAGGAERRTENAVFAGAIQVAVGLQGVDQLGLPLKGIEHPDAALVGQAQSR